MITAEKTTQSLKTIKLPLPKYDGKISIEQVLLKRFAQKIAANINFARFSKKIAYVFP